MVDYKEIIRMRHMGYSQRQIASSARSSHHTVKEGLELAETNSISWPLDESINNADLEMIFYPNRQRTATDRTEPDYAYIHMANRVRLGAGTFRSDTYIALKRVL